MNEVNSPKPPCHADHDRNVEDTNLFTPLIIRGVTLKNRLVYSPMCQYVAKNGFASDWHLVHLGSRAVGGAGLVFAEATAVTAQGRISPGDLGLWSDDHIEPLSRIANFIIDNHAIPAIQLAHAGRKASCREPWNDNGRFLTKEDGGWEVVAPSSIPFYENDTIPTQLDKSGIHQIIKAFKEAAIRAVNANFKVIEIHSAHGYLSHSFLSPLTNHRQDDYGGSLENRMRFLKETVLAVRQVIPQETPLFVRISATDWVEGGFNVNEAVQVAKVIKTLGVDLIDVSSGGIVPDAKIPFEPSYQVPFSVKIKDQSGILTSAVGLITEPDQANQIIASGHADLVFIGREMMRNPYFGLQAEKALDRTQSWPISYGYAVRKS